MPEKIGNCGRWSKEDLEKYARENLNEDPKRTEKDIKAIKDWVKKQPHLNKNIRTGEKLMTTKQVDYSLFPIFPISDPGDRERGAGGNS